MSDVLVVGCGLIGTSIGLALQGTAWGDVTLADADAGALELARRRGAGRAWDGAEPARLAVVAVPPALTAITVIELQRLDVAQTYTHVCSVQSQVQREVELSSPDPSQIVGGHPLAGREVSGPAAALSELFAGRPWALCPGSSSTQGAVEDARQLAERCGAEPLVVDADVHDRSVALLSHLPQLAASALAALLVNPALTPGDLVLQLSGGGLADTTRLAASNPDLWTQIVAANAANVSPPLRALGESLLHVAAALEGGATAPGTAAADAAADTVEALLRNGNRGRDRIPVKRGELAGAFVGVRVEVSDEPGRLAALLTTAGAAGVNVEDVRVDHVPGRPRGIIDLLVAASAAESLRGVLSRDGWHVV